MNVVCCSKNEHVLASGTTSVRLFGGVVSMQGRRLRIRARQNGMRTRIATCGPRRPTPAVGQAPLPPAPPALQGHGGPVVAPPVMMTTMASVVSSAPYGHAVVVAPPSTTTTMAAVVSVVAAARHAVVVAPEALTVVVAARGKQRGAAAGTAGGAVGGRWAPIGPGSGGRGLLLVC